MHVLGVFVDPAYGWYVWGFIIGTIHFINHILMKLLLIKNTPGYFLSSCKKKRGGYAIDF